MNYLAHLLLAEDSDASRIGNLLGDFATGTIESFAEQYPPEILRGIRMHRAVDRFTDSHKVFKEARNLLAPGRRRFAGIIIDIIFDHYLCRHWQDYSNQPLEQFIEEVYRALDTHPEWWAGRLSRVYPMMKHENWLMTYSSLEGISLTLKRVSTRSPRVTKIAGGADDLRENYNSFESHFHAFMPDLLDFADTWKRKN